MAYCEHTGTHIDAPYHFHAENSDVASTAPGSLIVPLVGLDVREKVAKDHDYRVGPEEIISWEKKHGAMPEGAAIFLNSGWNERYTDGQAYLNRDGSGVHHFPGFSEELTGFLLAERSIVGLALDTLSLDFGPSEKFPVHLKWLGASRWGLENLANLGSVPPSGAHVFVGAPKVPGGTGGPCRVFAVWK